MGNATIVLGPQFESALAYVNGVHADHIRKGTDTDGRPGVPYIAHLLGVCALVLEDGGGRDETIAALLHDVVEDRGGPRRLADVRDRFGTHVAAIVEHCTDAMPVPGAAKPLWRTRKQRYLARLAALPQDDPLAVPTLRVSMADKLFNLRAIVRDVEVQGERFWDMMTGGARGQHWYYESVLGIFEDRRPGPMAREMRRLLQLIAEQLPEPNPSLVTRGTHCPSKRAFADALRRWFNGCDEATVGDLSAAAGVTTWMTVAVCGLTINVHADTSRSAVERYLGWVEAHGPELPWRIDRGSRGTLNKVIVDPSGAATSGFFLYSSKPLPEPTAV